RATPSVACKRLAHRAFATSRVTSERLASDFRRLHPVRAFGGKGMKQSLLTVALLIAGGAASADPILSARPCPSPPCRLPGWVWEYTFTNPTGDADWATTGVWADSHMGAAPFGNSTFGVLPLSYFDFVTLWPVLDTTLADDLWVRTTIDLTGFSLG